MYDRERAIGIVASLIQLRKALDAHNLECPVPASVIMLPREKAEFLKAESLFGLRIVSSDEVRPGTVRFGCDGSAWKIDEEIAASGILGDCETDDDGSVE